MTCPHCGIEDIERTSVCRSCGLRTDSGLAVEYAGFWKRAQAMAIDTVILFLALGIIGQTLDIFIIEEKDLKANIAGLVLGWLYYAGMESSSRQATFGKQLIGIVVISLDGKRIGFYRATGRHFSKLVSAITLGLGYIMAGFTEKKQTLHDKMFDCMVVCRKIG
ncbi:MAG: RDD family protein [Deltaproteobacteria bacterium]|nr:RDD family protein [Deltaproteobacteria bacterium]